MAYNDYDSGVFLGPLSSLLLALPASISSITDKVAGMPLLGRRSSGVLAPALTGRVDDGCHCSAGIQGMTSLHASSGVESKSPGPAIPTTN